MPDVTLSLVSRWAVVFSAIASTNGVSGAKTRSSATCILFSVSVPVLSVHITVTAPIVSQACNLRTRLLLLSIRRMFNARLNVTAIGNPSGTVITNSVTAIMK